MKRIERGVSPAAFEKLQQRLLAAEMQGYGPTEAVAMAMTAIGIGPTSWPPEPRETVLVVDPTLVGTAYPFLLPDDR